jgi:hypothetical protein
MKIYIALNIKVVVALLIPPFLPLLIEISTIPKMLHIKPELIKMVAPQKIILEMKTIYLILSPKKSIKTIRNMRAIYPILTHHIAILAHLLISTDL